MPIPGESPADLAFIGRATGLIGVSIYVCSFFCLSSGRLSSHGPLYFCLVLAASSCVLASLLVDFNLSAALIQSFYILMSLSAIALRWRSWRSNGLDAL